MRIIVRPFLQFFFNYRLIVETFSPLITLATTTQRRFHRFRISYERSLFNSSLDSSRRIRNSGNAIRERCRGGKVCGNLPPSIHSSQQLFHGAKLPMSRRGEDATWATRVDTLPSALNRDKIVSNEEGGGVTYPPRIIRLHGGKGWVLPPRSRFFSDLPNHLEIVVVQFRIIINSERSKNCVRYSTATCYRIQYFFFWKEIY